MSALLYFLFLPFIFCISVMPFWLIYRISDILFLILYYIIGYRKRIVLHNLRNAFPGKSTVQIRRVRRRFFRYFCDFILETLKAMTISPATVTQRCRFTPEAASLLDGIYENGKSIIIVLGHYGNWELGSLLFSMQRKHQFFAIYKPLRNKYFDRLIYRARSRFGACLITMKDAFRVMKKQQGQITATAFLADQTPSPKYAYWTLFLNQETPVYQGTERIARKLKLPVVYMSVQRQCRGYYYLTAEVLTEKPELSQAGKITEWHTSRLQQDIINRPELWLWSHRRWKHRK